MSDLADRLRRPPSSGGPSLEATARARAAVAAARPRRTALGADALLPGGRRRMVGRVIAILAILAVAAAAVLSVVTADPTAPPAAPLPRLPEKVRLCDRPADEAELLGCVEGTAERRLGTPELRGAPWIYLGPGGQWRISNAPPRPSLVFPPGVTYPEALNRLFLWATLVGTLPPEATVAPALPDRAVLLEPENADEGIAIDLRAPWGWEPKEGRIMGPTLTSPAGVATQAPPGELWGRGQRVDVPSLPACQVIRTRDETPPPCTEGPVIRSSPAAIAPPLPVIRTDEPAATGPKLAYVDGPRCSFRLGAGGAVRAVIVEADYVNQGRTGRARFTGAVQDARSRHSIHRVIPRDVEAGEHVTIRIVVPLAAGEVVHLVGGRPECSIDAAP